MKSTPPNNAIKFLRWFCREDYLDEIEGDLIEIFEKRFQENPKKAARSFWWQVLRHFRPDYIKSFKSPQLINHGMFRNYFIIALRLFIRNRLISGINVSGLALALTGTLLITLFISDELSYDRYHKNADNIYRVTRNFLSSDGSETLHLGLVAPPFGPLLKNDFPDISEVARTHKVYSSLSIVEGNGTPDKPINVAHPFYAEPSIFTVFDIPMLSGEEQTLLENPYTMLVSDAMARRYFGTLDVIGKQLKLEGKYLEIIGVYEAFPTQSHWHPDLLVAFSTLNDEEVYGRKRLESSWGNNDFSTYVLVNDQFDVEKTQAQFPDFLDKHMRVGSAKPSTWTNLFLQPLTAIHLRSQLDHEVEPNANINHVYIMGAIGLFLLLIASFNFINLTTARATTRGKEVGLRKAIGALRQQLVAQHLSESILVALVSFILAIVLTSICLPWLNEFAGKSIQLATYINPVSILVGIGFVLLIGLVAGFYPALVISRLKTIKILKQQAGSVKGNSGVRRSLVIVQFTLSIVIMIATVVVYQQLDFLKTSELGYAKDQIVRVDYHEEFANNYESVYHDLTKHSFIKNATRSSLIPTGKLLDYQGTSVQQGDSLVTTQMIVKDVRVDYNFFDTYQVPLASGRSFSEEIKSDDSLAFIINESAAEMIGWTNEEAIGKVIQNGSVKGTIIGVAKDFHFESLHESIAPVVFHIGPHYNHISVQIATRDIAEVIGHLESIWQKFVPHESFQYSFLNDRYEQLYTTEQRQSKLLLIFAALAIFIATIGLFGLATFNALQRVKEIGIRKVLGASWGQILTLLSKETLFILLLANGIAWPVAWYAMKKWLNQFAYGIEPTWWIFVMAGVLAAVIALLSISYQSIKAAFSNPVNALRNE
ncbi:MAG: FtsX-like permease family protein [Bacteroidota bacterium]